MQLAEQLRAAGLPCFPCLQNKGPAVPKGVPWAAMATQPVSAMQWPSPHAGVPVPHGTVVLDLDTYKGVTREQIDLLIGEPLDWDTSILQTTLNGGQHYGFRAPAWPIKQGSNIGAMGFDTRVAGKGYICTGGQYQPVGLGVTRLAHPEVLPMLPESARHLLELIEHTHEQPEALPEGDRDIDDIREALKHVAPGLGRSEWVRIGLALRHHFHDDEATGLSLFDEWSRGDLWPDGAPHNYEPESTETQFFSFKAEGGTTISTLFYAAIQNGWRPPARMSIDAAAAFGAGAAAVDLFDALIDRIQEDGGNPKHIDALAGEIQNMRCSLIQRDILSATLLREMKDAGLATKSITRQLDQAAPQAPKVDGPTAQHSTLVDVQEIPAVQLARPEGVHGHNAEAMLREVFGSRAAVYEDRIRWWSGREWQAVPEMWLKTLCCRALGSTKSTASNVTGTLSLLPAYAPTLPEAHKDRRVYFRNGVLDLDDMTKGLQPHDINNFNTGTLTVDYTPNSGIDNWAAFVASIFGGEVDGLERRDLLQEIMGYALFKDTLNVQKVIALDGASRGGKSVALEVLQAILGHGACGSFTFGNLGDGKTQSSFRSYDTMLDIDAKPPMKQFATQALAFLNKVTSNEIVSIQLLNRQDPWVGRMHSKMIIACNGVPTMIDDSGASANRFQILRYTRSFAGKEDRGLLSRLLGELEGIAAWALEGAVRLIANDGKFTQPLTSLEASDELAGDNRPLYDFIRECCEIKPDLRCHRQDIWSAFQQWAAITNTRLPTRNQFYKSLRQTLVGAGVEPADAVRVDGHVSTGYLGLGVTSPMAGAFKEQTT